MGSSCCDFYCSLDRQASRTQQKQRSAKAAPTLDLLICSPSPAAAPATVSRISSQHLLTSLSREQLITCRTEAGGLLFCRNTGRSLSSGTSLVSLSTRSPECQSEATACASSRSTRDSRFLSLSLFSRVSSHPIISRILLLSLRLELTTHTQESNTFSSFHASERLKLGVRTHTHAFDKRLNQYASAIPLSLSPSVSLAHTATGVASTRCRRTLDDSRPPLHPDSLAAAA